MQVRDRPRLALGLSYRGDGFLGWQSQTNGRTVQDVLERAMAVLADQPIRVMCAGRTDAGVHAVQQVVHFDPPVDRPLSAWVRGVNSHLPDEVGVQWCHAVPSDFHARASARTRRYRYVCFESPVRPALEAGLVGWVFRPLDHEAMRKAAAQLVGEHDFSSFRAAECQAPTPVKNLMRLDIARQGDHWVFDFEANAFLHHMVRNLMGVLVAVGMGRYPASWAGEVLAARSRQVAAPTFAADGLYFVGPTYDEALGVPTPSRVWPLTLAA